MATACFPSRILKLALADTHFKLCGHHMIRRLEGDSSVALQLEAHGNAKVKAQRESMRLGIGAEVAASAFL
jgi:hypothetical protein